MHLALKKIVDNFGLISDIRTHVGKDVVKQLIGHSTGIDPKIQKIALEISYNNDFDEYFVQ